MITIFIIYIVKKTFLDIKLYKNLVCFIIIIISDISNENNTQQH